jgi:Ser/Thr protein kinase RdoA (MazF antagonist)
MDAIESTGRRCDGRLIALNSFENRVYQVGIDDAPPVVAKFYRPGRWSDKAIEEEHRFCIELAQAEIPVVPPMMLETQRTLAVAHGFRFALFEKRPGRSPELDNPATLEWLGRFIARIHAQAQVCLFSHRPSVAIESYGEASLAVLRDNAALVPELREAYFAAAEHALARARARYADAGAVRQIRLHADCHAGNILWTEHGPHFVDFDDCRMGPAIQDLWMLLSGDRAEMASQLATLIEGYRMFRAFNPAELWLLEGLRTLRMIHHSAWLAQRWDDPAFPAAFPWFGTQRYWQDQILALKEQIAAMDEPPLPLE